MGVTGLVFWLKCFSICGSHRFTPNEICGVIGIFLCVFSEITGKFLVCLYISADTIFTVYSFRLSSLVSCSVGYLMLCLPSFLFFFWYNSCFLLLLPSL